MFAVVERNGPELARTGKEDRLRRPSDWPLKTARMFIVTSSIQKWRCLWGMTGVNSTEITSHLFRQELLVDGVEFEVFRKLGGLLVLRVTFTLVNNSSTAAARASCAPCRSSAVKPTRNSHFFIRKFPRRISTLYCLSSAPASAPAFEDSSTAAGTASVFGVSTGASMPLSS